MSAHSHPIELLRFNTCGSVDDGKSTLIGRLLYDSKNLMEDQLEALERSADITGGGTINLANLTDGLRAEREQGITIDVAYRYFATPRRKFIVADTPGHVQYTRNMVTGASTADLAVVLIDARNGVLEQSRRHAFIAALLGIPHIVVAVNKMDLVGWSQQRFEEISAEFTTWAAKLDVHDITFIPLSALHGDNVVDRSTNMAWYEGPSLLYHLEHVHIASDRNLRDNRFPVQWIVRPMSDEHHDYRGYAGTVAAGTFKAGDDVVMLLEDDVDISRGDMICRPHNQPTATQDLEAMVCWMADRPLQVGGRYTVKHTTRYARAFVDGIRYRIDVNSLHRDETADGLSLNEIGRIKLRTSTPLLMDEYRRNRQTGAFKI